MKLKKKNEQGSYLPHGIISTNGETNHIQEGADHVDIYTETIDGKDTFYSMARAVFQVQSSSVGPIKRSLDRCLHITEASYDQCMSPFQEAKETCRTCPLCWSICPHFVLSGKLYRNMILTCCGSNYQQAKTLPFLVFHLVNHRLSSMCLDLDYKQQFGWQLI